jgi:pantetheine-phosphate adenylyltransferase
MKAARKKPMAVYAGSFDPLTIGHLWMIEEGVRLFGGLVVAIGVNPAKHPTFSLDDRLAMLRAAVEHLSGVRVTRFGSQYLIDYAREVGATHILRGIRSQADYEFERVMRNINSDLDSGITTVFLMPPRDIAEISSSMVRGLIGPRGWQKVIRQYVPGAVYSRLVETFDGDGNRKSVV